MPTQRAFLLAAALGSFLAAGQLAAESAVSRPGSPPSYQPRTAPNHGAYRSRGSFLRGRNSGIHQRHGLHHGVSGHQNPYRAPAISYGTYTPYGSYGGQTYVVYDSYPYSPSYPPQYAPPPEPPPAQPIYIVVERPTQEESTPKPAPAPAPPPRSTEPGEIWLSVEPPESQVYLDDRYLGTAATVGDLQKPLVLPPGVYVLEARHDDLPDERLVFGVEPNKPATVEIDLQAVRLGRRARLTTPDDLHLFDTRE